MGYMSPDKKLSFGAYLSAQLMCVLLLVQVCRAIRLFGGTGTMGVMAGKVVRGEFKIMRHKRLYQSERDKEKARRIRERNEFFIKHIDSVLPRYDSQVGEVQRIIKYYQSTNSGNINDVLRLPLSIPNPVEDSIHYIVCVEYYKVIALAIRDTFFNKNYHKMNEALLGDSQVKEYIDSSLDGRNTLAHIYISDYLDIDELDFDAMLRNLKGLHVILKVFVSYVRAQNKKKAEGSERG